MIGVVDCGSTKTQNVVVAGALALDLKAMDRIPDGRVEPVEAANALRKDMAQAVDTFDVSQFVSQDEPETCR